MQSSVEGSQTWAAPGSLGSSAALRNFSPPLAWFLKARGGLGGLGCFPLLLFQHPFQGYFNAGKGAAAWAGVDLEMAAKSIGPVFDIVQADAFFPGLRRVEALAVIFYGSLYPAVIAD